MPEGPTVVDRIVRSSYPLVLRQEGAINVSVLVDMSNREFRHNFAFVANSVCVLRQLTFTI